MDGFKLNGVSDVKVGGTLAKQVYIGSTKIWDYKTPPVYTAPTAKTGLVYNGSAKDLLNAGSTSHGTIYYSSDGTNWSTSIPQSTNASTSITVYWKLVGDGRHNDIASTAIVCSIAKVTPVVTAPTAKTLTYNGGNQYLVNEGSTNWGTLQYSLDGTNWGTSVPQGKNATSYTVYYRVVGNDNINSVSAASVACSIGKVTPTVTAPTAKALTYNESAQALVNAGSTNFGTLQYSLDNSTWGTSIPTATNYGSYTVYYRVVGDSNINSVASASVACSISEKKVTATVILSQDTYTYSGNACKPTVTVKDGNTVIPSSEYTVTYSNNVNAGTATVTITDNAGGNYDVIGSKTFTINKVTPTVTAPTAKTLTYTRGAQTLANAGSTNFGQIQYSSSQNGTYGTSIPTGVNAGSYEVWYKVVGNDNVNSVSAVKVDCAIGKATPVLSTSPSYATNLTYSGSAQNLLTGGAMKHSSSDATAVGGTFTYDQGTNATTYTNKKWYFAPTDSTNYNSTSGTVSGSTSIAKANPTYTAPSAAQPTYSGSAQNLISAGSSSHGTFTYSTSQTGTYSANIPQGTNAGDYTVWFKITGDSNHNDVAATQVSSVKIKQKSLTITAKAQSVTFGTAISTGTGQVTTDGLVSGDSLTSISLAASTTNVTTNGTITPSSAATTKGTGNYSITYKTGTLTITAKALTITASAQTIQWGNSIATGTGQVSVSGLVSGDSLTGITLTPSTSDITTSGTITPSAASTTKGASNYSITYTAGTLKITARSITITAKAQSVTYGTAITTGTGQVTIGGSGLVSGHSLTAVSLAASRSTVGSGTITPSSATIKNGTTDVTSKYSVSYSTGTLTITAKAITITAKAQTISYGSSIATGTGQVTVSGLVGSDSLTAITLAASTTAITTNGTITPSAATIKNGTTDYTGNYTINYATGNLTIVKANLSASVSMSGWTYGGTATNPSVSGNTGNGSVTYSYKVSGAADSTYTSTKPSTAGTYVVRAVIAETTNYNGATVTNTFTIAKANISPSVSMANWTYGGTASTPSVSGNTGSGSVTYYYKVSTAADSTYTTTKPSTAGSYTIKAVIAATTNYNGATVTNTFSIAKANPTYAAPTAKSLTYNGNDQTLANAGTNTTAGAFTYSSNGSSYGSSIPTGKTATGYTVYWKFTPTDTTNYNIISNSFSVTIGQATPTYVAPTAKSLTYTGSAQYLVNAGTNTTAGSFTYNLSGGSYSTSVPTATNANTSGYSVGWKFTPTDTTNYKTMSGTLSVPIAKKAASVSGKSLTYSRGSQALTSKEGDGTFHYKVGSGSWSTTAPTATTAATYTIYWYMDEGTNYKATNSSSSAGSVSSTIAKATPVLSTSPSAVSGWTYDGSAHNLLSGGAMKHSSSDTTAVAGTFSYGKATNAGTYTSATWSFTPTDSTNYNSTSGTVSSISVTVSKKDPTYVAPTAKTGLVYSGSSQTLYNAGSNTTAGSFSYSNGTRTNAGTQTVSWSFTPTDTTNYNSKSGSFTGSIARASRTISFTTAPSTVIKGNTITVAASPSAGSGDGAVSYSVTAGTGSASISGATITGSTKGTVTVTASVAQGMNYSSASKTYTLTVVEWENANVWQNALNWPS